MRLTVCNKDSTRTGIWYLEREKKKFFFKILLTLLTIVYCHHNYIPFSKIISYYDQSDIRLCSVIKIVRQNVLTTLHQ